MIKNPFLNALGALVYILLVSFVMNYVSHMHSNKADTFFAPVAILSLLTLSAVVMGYFFLFQPAQLYLDGNRKEATTLFTKTLLIFAGFTAVIFTLFLSGILH